MAFCRTVHDTAIGRAGCANRHIFAHGDAVTMQTEVDMRDLLFPKEQGPGLNPNPPREVGTTLFSMMAFCRFGVARWRNERLRAIFFCSGEVFAAAAVQCWPSPFAYRLSLRAGSRCRRQASLPAGPDWVHEIKHDGYRLQCAGMATSCGCSPGGATIGAAVTQRSS